MTDRNLPAVSTARMSTLARLAETWKAGRTLSPTSPMVSEAKSLELGHPRGSGTSFFIPNQDLAAAQRRVGDGGTNSAVVPVLNTKARAFSEPVPVVARLIDGNWITDPAHEISQLLLRPNPLMVWDFLADYLVWSTDLAGDAYLYKQRSALGDVVELWPLLPSKVTPQDGSGRFAKPEERNDLIAYYEYTPGGKPIRIEVADMIHLRMGLDRNNHRRGKAPVRDVLLEVMTDEEASRFTAWLLTNLGVPGVVISGTEENPIPDDVAADEISDEWQSTFTGRGRGKPFVPYGAKIDVQVLSFTPEQMSLAALRRVPEERISAAADVPASLAGLGAGITTGNALGGDLRATEKKFWTESSLVPAWRLYGRLLTLQLFQELGANPNTAIVFPLDEVKALEKDKLEYAEELRNGVAAGAVLVAEYRRVMGLHVDDSHEVFLRPTNAWELPDGENTPALDPVQGGDTDGT